MVGGYLVFFFLPPLGRDRYSIENGNFFDGIIRASVMGGWRAFTKDTKTRDSQQSSIDPQSDGQNLSFCFLLYSCCVLCGANNSHIVPLLLLLREETFSSGNQTWHSGGERRILGRRREEGGQCRDTIATRLWTKGSRGPPANDNEEAGKVSDSACSLFARDYHRGRENETNKRARRERQRKKLSKKRESAALSRWKTAREEEKEIHPPTTFFIHTHTSSEIDMIYVGLFIYGLQYARERRCSTWQSIDIWSLPSSPEIPQIEMAPSGIGYYVKLFSL